MGKPFPDCTMKNDVGKDVTLSEQWREGTVLLIFFSASYGFVCNLEMMTLTAMHEAFKKANCRIFGVSNDSTRTLGSYSENLKISFPLLSDEGARLARRLGVMEPPDSAWAGFTLRSEFIIDRHGIVRYAHIPPDSNHEPDYDELLAVVRQLAEEDA